MGRAFLSGCLLQFVLVGVSYGQDVVLPPGHTWEYTLTDPTGDADWNTTTGVGGDWTLGAAPFGTANNPFDCDVDGHFIHETFWPGNTFLWVRSALDLTDVDSNTLAWDLGVDNGFTLFLNGVLIDSQNASGYTCRWEYTGDFSATAPVQGINVIALELRDFGAPTAFDMQVRGLSFISPGHTILVSSTSGGPEVAFGGTVRLGVNALGGDGNLSYDWTKDGQTLGAPDSDELLLDGLTLSDSGAYSCTASDTSPVADATSLPLVVTVLPPRFSLNVPFFLDRAPADGAFPPSALEASFIALHNNLSTDLVLAVDYYDAGQDGVVEQRTPAPNTFLLPGNATYSFRPVRDDPTTETAGAVVPNMPGGETAGTAIISWEGQQSQAVQGRLLQINANGNMLAFLLPSGNAQ